MKNIIIEDEPEFSMMFNALSRRQKIKLLTESIRNEEDPSVRKVFKWLLKKTKSTL